MMDETQELLRLILSRLEEQSAAIIGLGSKMEGLNLKVENLGSKMEGLNLKVEDLSSNVEGLSSRVTSLEDKVAGLQDQIREFHDETGVQLAKIEGRFDHLTEKWMEHDLEIYKLKRRQA